MKKILLLDGDESFGFRFYKDNINLYSIKAIHGSRGILELFKNLLEMDSDFDYVINNFELPFYSNKHEFDLYNIKVQEAINSKFPDAFKILMSSQLVYADSDMKKDENSILRPKTDYGKTKLEAEKLVMPDKESLVIRRGITYGKCTSNIYTDMLAAIRGHIPLKLNNSILFNPVLNSDLSAAVRVLIDKSKCGIYNAGSSDVMTLYDMGSKLCSMLRPDGSCFTPDNNTKMNFNIDSSKIEAGTGIRMSSLTEIDFLDFII
ncbi:MAG: sugar nucleotide-binding protein [Ferroplasma sp.]